MVSVWFGCYVSYGPGCNSDWEEEIELTEDEYLRLIEAMKKSILDIEAGSEFDDFSEIKDIYDRVYEIVVDSATESCLDYDYDIVKDYFVEGKVWRADDTYRVGVVFPRDIYEQIQEEIYINED